MCEHFPGLIVKIQEEYIHEMMDILYARGKALNMDFFTMMENVTMRMRQFEERIDQEERYTHEETLFLLNLAMLTKFLYPIIEQMNESTLRHVSFDPFGDGQN